MINNTDINNGVINNTDILKNNSSIINQNTSTSFSSSLQTKYSFKSISGEYFNFNNFCILGKKYGNYIKSHNFNDIPDIELKTYSHGLKHGGIISNKKYTQKYLDIEIIITCNNILELEDEIKNLKLLMEKGGKCYKKQKDIILHIGVILIDIQIGRLKLTGTNIKIKMLTMDPFWTTNNNTIINENNSNYFNGSLNLNNTSISGFVIHVIYLKNITGIINEITLTLNGFSIIINHSVQTQDTIVLDGINGKVYINGINTRFLGQFPELNINIAYPLNIGFSGGGIVNNFDLYNIYPNQQL